jgi:hypothetical protein
VLISDDDNIIIEDTDADSLRSWVSERAPPKPTTASFMGKLKNLFNTRSNKKRDIVRDAETAAGMDDPQHLQTSTIAQHYHPDRCIIYNEAKSMRESDLTVAVEQVSIFLMNDGTVITFFQVCFSSTALTAAIWQSNRETYYAATGFREYYSSNVRGPIVIVAEYH